MLSKPRRFVVRTAIARCWTDHASALGLAEETPDRRRVQEPQRCPQSSLVQTSDQADRRATRLVWQARPHAASNGIALPARGPKHLNDPGAVYKPSGMRSWQRVASTRTRNVAGI